LLVAAEVLVATHLEVMVAVVAALADMFQQRLQ
jgi:hypothetical protein